MGIKDGSKRSAEEFKGIEREDRTFCGHESKTMWEKSRMITLRRREQKGPNL